MTIFQQAVGLGAVGADIGSQTGRLQLWQVKSSFSSWIQYFDIYFYAEKVF